MMRGAVMSAEEKKKAEQLGGGRRAGCFFHQGESVFLNIS